MLQRFSTWIILFPGLILLVLLLYPRATDLLHRQAFDPVAWKDTSAAVTMQAWPPRLTMVDDLLSSHNNLAGLSRRQLVELLGEAEPYPVFGTYDMLYRLGPERGLMRVRSEWLVISFNDSGISVGAEIRRD